MRPREVNKLLRVRREAQTHEYNTEACGVKGGLQGNTGAGEAQRYAMRCKLMHPVQRRRRGSSRTFGSRMPCGQRAGVAPCTFFSCWAKAASSSTWSGRSPVWGSRCTRKPHGSRAAASCVCAPAGRRQATWSGWSQRDPRRPAARPLRPWRGRDQWMACLVVDVGWVCRVLCGLRGQDSAFPTALDRSVAGWFVITPKIR